MYYESITLLKLFSNKLHLFPGMYKIKISKKEKWIINLYKIAT